MLSVTQNIKTQRILFREKGSLREEPVGGRRVFIDDNRLFLGQRERTAFALWVLMGEQDFIIWKDGEPDLAPWRKAKLEQELEELDSAEQYVLFVRIPGYYPCYSCFGEEEIFLNLGEIWKYGVTSKQEKGRYPQGLPVYGLEYKIQYEGPTIECYKQEKIKIYYYALLPENLRRARPLKRPPGNKRDN